MIDTIKFKLELDAIQYAELLQTGLEIRKRDNDTGKEIFRFVTKEIYVGSHDRKITIRAFRKERVEVELSLPKFLYGHNVFLLYQSQLEKVISQFHDDIASVFPSVPHYDEWEIVRLDLCYAWKFIKDEQARQVLLELQKLAVARKKSRIYPNESVMFLGSTLTYKFYMKKPEFYYHDFRALKKTNEDLAYRTLDTSDGVLRFEVTMRKKSFSTYFKKTRVLTLKELMTYNLEKLLNKHLKKVMRGISTEPTDSQVALEKLTEKFSQSKARQLWQFWLLYFSKDMAVRKEIRNQYHRTTNWRNLRDIGKAGVGIPKETFTNEFELSIPSDIVINHDPLPER